MRRKVFFASFSFDELLIGPLQRADLNFLQQLPARCDISERFFR